MDLKSLQVFLAVCRNLSFTETAAAQHMSVSAVSRTVQRLEDNLGATLFDRDRRSMRPTRAALSLQPVAENMLADWRGLQHAMGRNAAVSGDLRLFCSVTATHQLLSPLLAAFREACPRVDVRLQTGDQADGIPRVTDNHTDVAVVARPQTLPSSLSFLEIFETPMVLCLPLIDCALSRGLAAKRGAALWAALDEVPWILPERGVSAERIDHWFASRRGSDPQIYARVAGHEAIAVMVSLGLGAGILPSLVVESSAVAGSLRLEPVAGLQNMHVGLCVRKTRLADPLVAALWQAANAGV